MVVIYVVESSKQAPIVSVLVPIQKLVIVFTLATASKNENINDEKQTN